MSVRNPMAYSTGSTFDPVKEKYPFVVVYFDKDDERRRYECDACTRDDAIAMCRKHNKNVKHVAYVLDASKPVGDEIEEGEE